MEESREQTIVACILAGGAGTRLYPASRQTRPKPLLSFDSDSPLLADTLERVGFADETIILTREQFRADIAAAAGDTAVLTEPAGKDTGPALVYATWEIRNQYENAVVVTLPSDHRVLDSDGFSRAAATAAEAALEGSLITLGVDPTRPATEYGYITPATDTEAQRETESIAVEKFVEKPDKPTARSLVDSGALWNAGVFAWTPETFFRHVEGTTLAPMLDRLRGGDPAAAYDAIEAVSVDTAVMERADDVLVVPVAAGWSDLGTWDAVGRLLESNSTVDDSTIDDSSEESSSNQSSVGTQDTEQITLDASGNVIAAPGKHVSLIGVDDLVVAAYDDRILVAPRESSDQLRQLVERLREQDQF